MKTPQVRIALAALRVLRRRRAGNSPVPASRPPRRGVRLVVLGSAVALIAYAARRRRATATTQEPAPPVAASTPDLPSV